jgi:hypothetical protein
VGEGTAAARAEVLAARAALDEELIRLQASARASVDIPAKVRANPVKAAGIAAGVGFVAVGGPRRLFRRAKTAVLGPEEPLPESMLPEEIEKALKRMGGDGARVRGLLEREFADYLRQSEKERRSRDFGTVMAGLLRDFVRLAALRYGRQVIEQVMDPNPTAFQQEVQRIRARRAAAGIDGPPGGPQSGAGI